MKIEPTIPYPIPHDLDAQAEEIFEFVYANTPEVNDKGKLKYPWPHNSFDTMAESAKNHYRLCAFYCLQKST